MTVSGGETAFAPLRSDIALATVEQDVAAAHRLQAGDEVQSNRDALLLAQVGRQLGAATSLDVAQARARLSQSEALNETAAAAEVEAGDRLATLKAGPITTASTASSASGDH